MNWFLEGMFGRSEREARERMEREAEAVSMALSLAQRRCELCGEVVRGTCLRRERIITGHPAHLTQFGQTQAQQYDVPAIVYVYAHKACVEKRAAEWREIENPSGE